MPRRIETWRHLLGEAAQPLLAAAEECDPTQANQLARLRRGYPANLVEAALQLVEARRKAKAKFPDRADRMLADTEGVEQATAWRVALYKARRFADLSPHLEVMDLCCGIGGDAMAMTDLGLFVTTVDCDPLRAWMASHNAGCNALCADVRQLSFEGRFFHLDPSRRNNKGRIWRLEDYQPGPDFIRQLVHTAAGAAVKLGPGADLRALREMAPDAEIELISDDGQLVQALLWSGALRQSTRAATLIDTAGHIHTVRGEAGEPPLRDLAQWLYTVDPALERARLLHVLCQQSRLAAPHPSLGLLTAEEPIHSPWLTPFELIEVMPWRARKVKQWLRERDGGIVEVKTRGQAVDPDIAQQELRGEGDTPYTLFVLRFDEKVKALITRRHQTTPATTANP